ncbi:MAG: DUF192 domain-containing protein [Alphaproteobacteria bacterium]
MNRAAVAIAVLLAACSPQAAPGEPANANAEAGRPQTGLELMQLRIRSAGAVHRFTVEVARSAEEQRIGMMFRTSVPDDRGMLFPYDPPQLVAFWMRNTLIPLDMVFIRADGTIARIATAVPLSDVPVPSGEPVSAVLEIRGGLAAQLGIKAGDKVEW